MKLRFVLVEADDVDSSEVVELLQRALPQLTPSAPAPLPAAASTAALPPAMPTAIAPMGKGWRPRQQRRPRKLRDPDAPTLLQKLGVDEAEEQSPDQGPRPETPEIIQCKSCGNEGHAGTDLRTRCPKCSGRWERIPARTPHPPSVE